MHGNDVIVLAQCTTAHAAQLLHVTTHTQQQAHVDAERPDICASLAANPEHGEMTVVVEFKELALVNGTDTELTLDGRDERRALEEGTSESLEDAGQLLRVREGVVKAKNSDVLLSCALLGLDQPCRTVDADNQATSDLGVKSTAVTGLLYPKHATNPCDDFVRRRVGGLVQVDDSGPNRTERSLSQEVRPISPNARITLT